MTTLFTEVIAWRDARAAVPVDDSSVLVLSPESDFPVWIGFYDGERWVSADLVEYEKPVTAWARLPSGVVS